MHRRHRRGGGGCGPGYRGGRVPSREEWLRALEERQRDLEEEIADVAELIRRLKDERAETTTV